MHNRKRNMTHARQQFGERKPIVATVKPSLRRSDVRPDKLATRSGRSARHADVRKKLRWAESKCFANDELEFEYEQRRPRCFQRRPSICRRVDDHGTMEKLPRKLHGMISMESFP